ncbi:hypothetical protein EZV62_023241 [Acer yangbiense]|uniref:CCHC-type domain-containing protein n=1 Tax=Acer yangbiense TaxID=1000413 RepID=A0A5C7H1K3_9ROSI|nr:hypothetical protein EZV62_023241 [Acer yangbiense]
MNSEDITSLCASLSINSCDGPVQLLDDRLKVEAINRLSLCLVGRILTRKWVNRDAFIRVIGKIWQVKKGLDIESVSGNTFTFHFRDEYDLVKVMAGSPWSFDNALIAMEKPTGMGTIEALSFSQADFWVQIHQIPLLCMTREIGRFLGGMIGKVLDIDGGSSGDCVGKFMRVRIQIDITKSLKRCLRVDIMGDGVETILILRYERLPNHCFKCGMINHFTSECVEDDLCPTVNGKVEYHFGAWLRASGAQNKSTYNSQRGSFFSPVKGKEMNPVVAAGIEISPILNVSDKGDDIMDLVSTLMCDPSEPQEQEELAGDRRRSMKKDVRPQENGSINGGCRSH